MFRDIKLDDRSFDDIRSEVISNITRHCPEWTNHNASDPGITLVELFAYMTEMTQFRLNQVPEKNYLAFLDLLGVKQRLPLPAYSRVCFDLSAGYQMDTASKNTITIPQNTKIATQNDEDDEEVVFETKKSTYVSNTKLLNIYSKTYDTGREKTKVFDYSNSLNSTETFIPFTNNGRSQNKVEIYLYSDDFYVLKNDVNMTIVFRLPTTMRTYNISDDFLERIEWQYYDGELWHNLHTAYDLTISVDDKDADILSITFEGNCENLQTDVLEKVFSQESYFIRGTLKDIPNWLEEFSVYEVSVMTNANQEGVLPDDCFYNYELIDLNNSFFPFGTRPTLDASIIEEVFYIQCDQAFCEQGTAIDIYFDLLTSGTNTTIQGYDGLQIVYEYSIGEGKWGTLNVVDNTFNFTQAGNVAFDIPDNINKVIINAKEGYWVRAKIISGNYGEEETSTYENGEVQTNQATLNPPILSSLNIKYSLKRKDLEGCTSLNNYQYENIVFDKNRPLQIFKTNSEQEDALFFGFDSYLSEQYLDIFFDIEPTATLNNNQRLIQWEILIDNEWKKLKVEDNTDSLNTSGDIRLHLPLIDKLESYSLYLESLDRMWIKAKIKFNTLDSFATVNNVLLNSVVVMQKETYKNEVLGYSNGLPDVSFHLQNKNLISSPSILVDEEIYKAVDRFIDYGFDDQVFIFNGLTGKIEFGDGKHGKIPPLGAKIVVNNYEITQGSNGNVAKDKISILKDSINYVDSVSNISMAKNGHNGDTVDDLKRNAPNMLNTMNRAVTIEDYEHLALSYSPYIKKAKCILKDSKVVVLIMSENILRDKGFINVNFINSLEKFLSSVSIVTVVPRVESVNIVNVKIKLKLKYTDDTNVPTRSKIESELLEKLKTYLNPFNGLKGDGYEIGRVLLKSDIVRIINNYEVSLLVSELEFIKNGVEIEDPKVTLAYNEIIDLKDVMIEELSYDF